MAQTSTITFPDGDYPTRLSNAYAAFQEALEDEQNDDRRGPRRVGETPASVRLAAEYNALKAEAEADAHEKRRVVTVRALGRSEWRRLKEAHPPRTEADVDAETAKSDRMAGVNIETVEDDLVFAAVVEPEFTSRADYDEWADTLSHGEFQAVLTRAWSLVRVAQADPKSLPPSPTLSSAGN